jgi:hypothetical protein
MADNLPPSSADVKECGSHNLPEPSKPVMGLLYFYAQYYKKQLLGFEGEIFDKQGSVNALPPGLSYSLSLSI